MPENVHATGLVLGGRGVLLRGPSGSGKSLLALDLIEARQAVLVGDDRLDLTIADGALHMAVPEPLAGLIELRGRGIVGRPYRPVARVDLVIDLVDALTRMPEAAEFSCTLLGLSLPRCPVPRRGIVDPAHQMLLILEALNPGVQGTSPLQ